MPALAIVLRVLVLTALVAGLAYWTSRYLRWRWASLARSRHLEVLDAVAMGSRHHLALVRIGRRVLCLGVTPDAIRPLLVLGEEDATELLRDGDQHVARP